MLEVIGFLILATATLFVGLLTLAGFLIIFVFVVILPASVIIRILTPKLLD